MSRSLRQSAIALLAPFLLSVGVQARTDVAGVQFADLAASGQTPLGAFRGSIGVIDFDRDGWYDLFVNDDNGRPKRLLRNIADAAVPGGRRFQDVSAAAGLTTDTDGLLRGGIPVVVFDYDNDGWSDVWCSGLGSTASGTLYRNNGNGTFSNATAASGVRVPGTNPLCASAIDFDHDGFTDLMIVSSGVTPTKTLTLLRNTGAGAFVSRPDLLPPVTFTGTTYAMGFTDFDHDGWEDALVLFNAGRPLMLKNIADLNGQRRFVDATTVSGFTTIGPAPMGIAFGDTNNDGWLDIAITDAVSGTYFENRAGTLVRTTPYSTFFGWGTTFIDADNDGRQDNYQAGSYGTAAVSWLLLNRPGQWVDARAALNTPALASQECSRVDFDNDGREDILTVNPQAFISVLHNQSITSNHWLRIRLVGGAGVNPDAVGAVIRVAAAGQVQIREIALGTSFGASEDPRAHFGLGAADVVDRVEILWPRPGNLNQRTDIFSGPFAPDQQLNFTPRPRCDADFNRDGAVTLQDLYDDLAAYFADDARADTNSTGGLSVQDLFDFLALYFAGCA